MARQAGAEHSSVVPFRREPPVPRLAIVSSASDFGELVPMTRGAQGRPRGDRLDVVPLACTSRERQRDEAVNLSELDRSGFRRIVQRMAEGMIASATPERADRLFPGVDGPAPNDSVTFGRGAAGVLWALTEVGADVPDVLTDWLVDATERLLRPGPGLANGLSGIALALDRLGRHEEAGRLWWVVENTPLERMDVTLADGLPGVGLALLERAPITDSAALTARVEAITSELAARINGGTRWDQRGLLHGGLGAALFLLHAYELGEDPSLQAPVETAMYHDLAWVHEGGYEAVVNIVGALPAADAHGFGTPMVLSEAMDNFDIPWLEPTLQTVVGASESHLSANPGLSAGRAGMILGLQRVQTPPKDAAVERLSWARRYLDLTLHVSDQHPRESPAPMGLIGASGVLVALDSLSSAGDRRLPFF